MKRLMKWIIPLLLVVLIITSAFWYMLVYDRSTVQDFLNAQARNSAKNGHFDTATWFYNLSYQLSDQDQNVAIELAEIYKSAGNYTKAEATLTNAIADGGTAELYIALCKTFVEQDKLLDAVTMLENIADPDIKAELDAQRPAAPTVDQAPGFYSEYITLNFSHEGGTLYVSTDGDYPSTASSPNNSAVTLEGGETKIYALCVAENGLVSPISIFNYTIGGVIEDVTLADPSIDALVRSKLSFNENTMLSTKDLWSITELDLSTGVTTLEDLKYFIHLEKLNISGLNLTDLSMLSGMTKLQELNITNCTVSASLAPLNKLTALTHLTISGSSVSALNELTDLHALTYLDLSDNAIGNISALANMTALEQVNLSQNAITDPAPLAGLTKLTKLNLSSNALTSVSALGSCTALTSLDVSGNGLTDLSALGKLTGLHSLWATNNALTNVDALSACTSLEELNVSHNQIASLECLSGITSLRELNFAYNLLTSIPYLGDGSELVKVVGDNNQITDISALAGLPRLNYVFLDYNPDLSDVSALTSCSLLAQLDVFGTQVTSDSVAPLISMDVVVNYDPT